MKAGPRDNWPQTTGALLLQDDNSSGVIRDSFWGKSSTSLGQLTVVQNDLEIDGEHVEKAPWFS